jgi:hypothetical protein
VISPVYLMSAYRCGYAAGLAWRDGMPVRCPFWTRGRWLAWHAGFDRALFSPPPSRIASGRDRDRGDERREDRDRDPDGE